MRLATALLVLALLTLLATLPARSQTVTVETLLTGTTINDALVFGPDGALYGARWGAGAQPGRTVTRVDLGDLSTSIFVDELDRANGIGFDAAGNFYVVNYAATTRTVEQITPDGTRSVYATAASGNLSGLVVHPTTDVVYVTNYTNDTVDIATGDGTLTPFLSGGGIDGPVGLAVDDEGVLYVSNFNDGKIFSVSEAGDLTEIADLDGPAFNTTGFIAYGGGYLFATNIGGHYIERVSLADGSVETIAGTGTPGTADGPGATAQFSGPNGIVSNAAGDTLYVSDFNTRALRRIVIGGATAGEPEAAPQQVRIEMEVYPNPSAATTSVRFRLIQAGSVTVSLYDLVGRRVRSAATYQGVGWNEVGLDVAGLAPGLYLVRVQSEDAHAVQRLHVLR